MSTRILSVKQIERQLQTWKKKNISKYHEIMSRANVYDALTPITGKISKAKKNKENVTKFQEYYSKYVGSYSRYKKEIKEIKREYQLDNPNEPIYTLKQFEEKYNRLTELLTQFWEEFIISDKDIGDSNWQVLAEEEEFLRHGISLDDAINRLTEELKRHEILGIEQYADKYGDYNSPFL